MWDDAYEDVSYIGDLKKLPIPYAISDERVIATLGNTSDLFCCEGEDWLSQEMGRVNREFLREYALENAQERSRQTFLDREMPYLVVA